MHCKIIQHIPYNQGNNISDILVGGRCFAYAALYFNYVSTYIHQQLSVDYSALNTFLDKVDVNTKKTLMNTAEEIAKYDQKIAILNDNIHENGSYQQRFEDISLEMLEHLEVLKDNNAPAVYFIRFNDPKQKLFNQPLKHIVALYLVSPTEIHFFDSNSGTYVLNLPENYTKENLKDDLFDLMFKQSVLFKWFFTPYTETFEFEAIRSFFNFDYSNNIKKQLIFDCIQTLSQDPMQSTDFLKEMDFDELTVQFIERHALALRVQQEVALKKLQKMPGCFDPLIHHSNSLTQSAINFFTGNRYQPVANDNAVDEKHIVHSVKKI